MAARRVNDRRRSQRFPLALPLRVVRASSEAVAWNGRTKNLSSVGAYFVSDAVHLDLDEPIEFVVTLRERPPEGPLELRCKGRVIRIDPAAAGVAATIDRYRFIRP